MVIQATILHETLCFRFRGSVLQGTRKRTCCAEGPHTWGSVEVEVGVQDFSNQKV